VRELSKTKAFGKNDSKNLIEEKMKKGLAFLKNTW